MIIEEPFVVQCFLGFFWHFVILDDCSSQVEGQAGFGLCVTAVDQTGRNANDISGDRPAGGVDRVRVEPEGCDDGGNIGGSQPVPLGFVDCNIGEDYGRSVEVVQGGVCLQRNLTSGGTASLSSSLWRHWILR